MYLWRKVYTCTSLIVMCNVKIMEKLMRLLFRTSIGNDTIVGEVDAVRSLQRTCTLVTFYAKNA